MRERTRSGIRTGCAVFLTALLAAAQQPTPVADAVMQGDLEAVRSLLRSGADVNAAQGDGMTPLHWAANRGDLESAQALIYAGANPRAMTRLGKYTPLILASMNGHAGVIEVLIKAGSDVHATTTNGTTPLHLAAASGRADAVAALLEAGADVNARESVWEQTPLMFAAANNRTDAMSALIEGGADLGLATKVVMISDLSAQASEERRIRNARVEALKQAEEGPPPGQGGGGRGGRGGFQRGGRGGQQQAQRGRGGQRGQGQRGQRGQGQRRGGRGGQQAAGQGQRRGGGRRGRGAEEPPAEAQAQARQAGGGRGRVDTMGGRGGLTALLHAARQGHIEAARLLLDRGADVNQQHGGDQSSPLMMAAINGHFDLAMMLLERGADPNLTNLVDAGPLYGAINVQWAPTAFYPQPSTKQEKTTHLELMEALLKAGADPNARLEAKVWYTGYNFDQSGENETGATAFWRAAQSADVEAMRLLTAYGADPKLSNTVTREFRARRAQTSEEPVAEGDPDAVVAAYEAALQERRDALGDQHPATLSSIHDLGVLLHNLGKLDEAEPYLREAFEGRREKLGYEHPATLATIHRMGAVLSGQGKAEEAASLYRAVLALRPPGAADDDPVTVALTEALARAENPDENPAEPARADAPQPSPAAGATEESVSEASAAELRGEEAAAEEPEDELPDLGPPTPIGGPATSALHMAAGAGYDGNYHVVAPYGRMPAVRFLIEELEFDVNGRDHNGYTPLHHAAFRGDNEMILYLVDKGGDPLVVARNGRTTVDMANGPIQRLQPFEDTIALLESMGAKNNHRAVSR